MLIGIKGRRALIQHYHSEDSNIECKLSDVLFLLCSHGQKDVDMANTTHIFLFPESQLCFFFVLILLPCHSLIIEITKL